MAVAENRGSCREESGTVLSVEEERSAGAQDWRSRRPERATAVGRMLSACPVAGEGLCGGDQPTARRKREGAGDEVRTRDILLGRQALYR
jgi:hypothetical protein